MTRRFGGPRNLNPASHTPGPRPKHSSPSPELSKKHTVPPPNFGDNSLPLQTARPRRAFETMNRANWKRTFSVIWSGQLISILSSSIVGYAITFWISLETGSASVLAAAAVAGLLPQILLSPLIGVYVDRWDRKRTMIAADGFIALCTLALALLFRLGAAELWHVYLLLACRSAGSAFHLPAMQASVPLLAPEQQLTRIAGVNQMIAALSNIAGPALGALLLSFAPIGDILLLDVAGALVACLTLLCVPIPRPARKRQKHDLRRELREGLASVRNVRGLAGLFALSILALFFIMPIGVLFPLMTLDRFGGGTFEMSLIQIVWGGGSLLGGALMSLRRHPVNRAALVCAANVVVGLSFALSGLLPAHAFGWFVLLTAAEGIAGGVFNASFISVVQTRLEPGVLGRVLSIYFGLGQLPAAAGLLGAGFLVNRIGLADAFLFAGLAIVLIGLAGLRLPGLLELDRRR